MIIKRVWLRCKEEDDDDYQRDYVYRKYHGWFLFGFIPIYITSDIIA